MTTIEGLPVEARQAIRLLEAQVAMNASIIAFQDEGLRWRDSLISDRAADLADLVAILRIVETRFATSKSASDWELAREIRLLLARVCGAKKSSSQAKLPSTNDGK